MAFVIKIPVIPVHSWLPDAHTEAPTAGSVILAGLLLKTGAYALLRFAFPLFPMAARSSVPLLLVLGLMGLFYAAWIALAQKDIKRLVAYSSIAHMGLVVIGIAIWNMMTLSGAVLQMINHGLSTSALFILVGMLDERVQSREISNLGGLWEKMPIFSAFFLLFAMASLGMPGLNNFVGEILILIGTFGTWPWVPGSVLPALYCCDLHIVDGAGDAIRRDQESEQIKSTIPGRYHRSREVVILVPLAAGVLLSVFIPGRRF